MRHPLQSAAKSHPLCLLCSPSSGCWNNSPHQLLLSAPRADRALEEKETSSVGNIFRHKKNKSSHIWKDQMNCFHTSHKAASTLAFCFRTGVGFWSKSPSHQLTMHWLSLQSCFDAHELDSSRRKLNQKLQPKCAANVLQILRQTQDIMTKLMSGPPDSFGSHVRWRHLVRETRSGLGRNKTPQLHVEQQKCPSTTCSKPFLHLYFPGLLPDPIEPTNYGELYTYSFPHLAKRREIKNTEGFLASQDKQWRQIGAISVWTGNASLCPWRVDITGIFCRSKPPPDSDPSCSLLKEISQSWVINPINMLPESKNSQERQLQIQI